MSTVGSLHVRESMVGDVHRLNKIHGYSAYDLAVAHGFKGTEKEWLLSLVGKSAYEVAVEIGFEGTLEDWVESLKGEKGDPGTMSLHGELDALGERIMNVADPVDDGDAVNKKYLKDQNNASKDYVDDNFFQKGDQLDAANHTVTGVADPENDTDAVNKKYADNTFRKNTDQIDALNKTVVNVATPENDTDAVNKKYVHDTFQKGAIEDISEDFISQVSEGFTVSSTKVYKQCNTVYGSISFTVQENALTNEGQLAIDITNKYKPVCDIVCPIMVKTIVDDSAVMYLSTGMAAYIEPVTGWIFLPEYSDNAGFTNEFTISFTYLC